MYVSPRTGDRAALHRELQERVNKELYEHTALHRLDAPLVMKLGTHHFPVHGDCEVPEGTLEVPEELLADTDLRNPPSLEEIFLAKADVAARLLALTGHGEGAVGL